MEDMESFERKRKGNFRDERTDKDPILSLSLSVQSTVLSKVYTMNVFGATRREYTRAYTLLTLSTVYLSFLIAGRVRCNLRYGYAVLQL